MCVYAVGCGRIAIPFLSHSVFRSWYLLRFYYIHILLLLCIIGFDVLFFLFLYFKSCGKEKNDDYDDDNDYDDGENNEENEKVVVLYIYFFFDFFFAISVLGATLVVGGISNFLFPFLLLYSFYISLPSCIHTYINFIHFFLYKCDYCVL